MQKNEFDALKANDLYSLVLFALYKMKELPEYSVLSQLAYVLDRKSILSLCEYFGGMTIKIPTVDQLEDMFKALLIYEQVNLNHKDLDSVISNMNLRVADERRITDIYYKLMGLLEDYSFEPVN